MLAPRVVQTVLFFFCLVQWQWVFSAVSAVKLQPALHTFITHMHWSANKKAAEQLEKAKATAAAGMTDSMMSSAANSTSSVDVLGAGRMRKSQDNTIYRRNDVVGDFVRDGRGATACSSTTCEAAPATTGGTPPAAATGATVSGAPVGSSSSSTGPASNLFQRQSNFYSYKNNLLYNRRSVLESMAARTARDVALVSSSAPHSGSARTTSAGATPENKQGEEPERTRGPVVQEGAGVDVDYVKQRPVAAHNKSGSTSPGEDFVPVKYLDNESASFEAPAAFERSISELSTATGGTGAGINEHDNFELYFFEP
ncbi:unnamed protein product [Amoebophrya sp. A120]|nr:unnamed protein product [Amoebophrya sp. A120]|eukprot:GSA120T00021033001.1